MEYKFSEKLRLRLIEYFKRVHGLEVSHETAEEWLDSLGSLFLTFDLLRENKQ